MGKAADKFIEDIIFDEDLMGSLEEFESGMRITGSLTSSSRL